MKLRIGYVCAWRMARLRELRCNEEYTWARVLGELKARRRRADAAIFWLDPFRDGYLQDGKLILTLLSKVGLLSALILRLDDPIYLAKGFVPIGPERLKPTCRCISCNAHSLEQCGNNFNMLDNRSHFHSAHHLPRHAPSMLRPVKSQ